MEQNKKYSPKLVSAYQRLTVGADAWIRAGQEDLRTFQASVVAVAEALEFIGLIRIMEIREDPVTGERLIDALRFRRIK